MSLELLLNAAEFLEQQEKGIKKGEDKKGLASDINKSGSIVRGNSTAQVAAPYTPHHGPIRAIVPHGERQILSVPSLDDRHLHHRRQGFHPYPSNGRSSPHVAPQSFSVSPSLNSSSSSSSSSSLDSSPLGVPPTVAYKLRPESVSDVHIRGVLLEQALPHLSPRDPQRARLAPNGLLRPNGLSKSPSPCGVKELDDILVKEESKRRSGTVPSREVHNKLEKNRRAHLKECFEFLKKQLPSMEDKKVSNQTILKAAHRYIMKLKSKEREYEHEMERLARQKIAHQQRFSSLKRELQAKWDHIDFSLIVPDAASIEQNREKETKSTTTASEQPDIDEETYCGGSSYDQLNSCGGQYQSHASMGEEKQPPTVPKSESILYQDPNQPLNLSTNVLNVQRSPTRRQISPSLPNQHERANGEWSQQRGPHPATSLYLGDDKTIKPAIGRGHPPGAAIQMARISSTAGCNQISTLSTIASHIVPGGVKSSIISQAPLSSATVVNQHISHLVKTGATLSHLPSIAKVVTPLSSLASTTPSISPVYTFTQNSIEAAPGKGQTNHSSTAISSHLLAKHDPGSLQSIPTTVTIGTTLSHMGATGRISAVSVSNDNNSSFAIGNQEHGINLVSGGGIQLPAQLLAGGVQLSGPAGSVLGQPAIQVITPEGYKLLPTEHNQNGSKPLAITLTHSGGLEHLTTAAGEEGKASPVMVTLNKGGLSTLHLTMPAVPHRNVANSVGSVPVTSVPLNLTVGSPTGSTVKVTQAGSTSLIPSYIPLTHANGITQLVQGMSLVGPLVVSQSQRGIVVPSKALKGPVGVPHSAGIPLVPQYTGGLVNSVVVLGQGAQSAAVSAAPTLLGPTHAVGLQSVNKQ